MEEVLLFEVQRTRSGNVSWEGASEWTWEISSPSIIMGPTWVSVIMIGVHPETSMQCCGRAAGGLNFSGWGLYTHMDRVRRGQGVHARV